MENRIVKSAPTSRNIVHRMAFHVNHNVQSSTGLSRTKIKANKYPFYITTESNDLGTSEHFLWGLIHNAMHNHSDRFISRLKRPLKEIAFNLTRTNVPHALIPNENGHTEYRHPQVPFTDNPNVGQVLYADPNQSQIGRPYYHRLGQEMATHLFPHLADPHLQDYYDENPEALAELKKHIPYVNDPLEDRKSIGEQEEQFSKAKGLLGNLLSHFYEQRDKDLAQRNDPNNAYYNSWRDVPEFLEQKFNIPVKDPINKTLVANVKKAILRSAQ